MPVAHVEFTGEEVGLLLAKEAAKTVPIPDPPFRIELITSFGPDGIESISISVFPDDG